MCTGVRGGSVCTGDWGVVCVYWRLGGSVCTGGQG